MLVHLNPGGGGGGGGYIVLLYPGTLPDKQLAASCIQPDPGGWGRGLHCLATFGYLKSAVCNFLFTTYRLYKNRCAKTEQFFSYISPPKYVLNGGHMGQHSLVSTPKNKL